MSTPETPAQQVVVQQGNGLGVAGFVCGLLAAIFGLIPFLFFLSFLLGVLGIVFGAIGRNRAVREPARGAKGLSTAGLILGIVGVVLATISLIVGIANASLGAG